MRGPKSITAPLKAEAVEDLRVGDMVLLSGVIFTARDLAHKRMYEAIVKGSELPFSLDGQVIYYCGPSPANPGRPIGACGPTTSSRMDPYTPLLLKLGLKGMIGKGKRSREVREAMVERRAIYFGATGGAGAFYSQFVLTCEVLAYEDLGPEAIFRLHVKDMPLFVLIDAYDRCLYDLTRPISQTR